MTDVVVVGQVGRDLVLRIGALPEAGGAAPVGQRRELLGGKGANQAVAFAQLGVPVALVGVVGEDAAGADVVGQAAADGIDVRGVVARPGARTALLVDVVEDGGRRRLLEDVPPEVLLTAGDVARAADLVAGAQVLSLQLQQPGEAVRAALDRAAPGAVVVADGAPADEATRTAVLARADVLRADATEAELLLDRRLDGLGAVREAAAELLVAGPRLVALDAGADGDLVAWRSGPRLGVAALEFDVDPDWADGETVVPLLGGDPVDPTGAGDSYVAALVAALLGGAAPGDAAWIASAAAASTVGRPGGRPGLVPADLGATVRRHRPDRARR